MRYYFSEMETTHSVTVVMSEWLRRFIDPPRLPTKSGRDVSPLPRGRKRGGCPDKVGILRERKPPPMAVIIYLHGNVFCKPI